MDDSSRGDIRSLLKKMRNYRLVTQVNPVKCPNGGDAAVVPRTQVMQPADQFHTVRSPA